MTKVSIGYLSDLCRSCVGQIARPLGLVFILTSAAPAGAWDAFEQRCLKPMENVVAPDIRGLRPLDVNFFTDRQGYQVDDRSGFVLYVGSDEGAVFCTISLPKPARLMFLETAKAHFEKQINVGRYVVAEQYPTGFLLHSNHWREPVLAIEMGWLPTSAPKLIVLETDLES